MNKNRPLFSPVEFNIQEWIIVLGLSALYLLVSYFLIGTHSEQFVLIILFSSFFFLSKQTRKFILGFSVFAVFWIIFDYMKALPNYTVSTVHIKGLYDTELSIFGIHSGNTVLTPNQFLKLHQEPWIDVMSGLFYLCWMPVPLLFAGYLFFTRRPQVLLFSLTFLTVNLVGFCLYYSFPAAPPWYVELYGFDFHPETPGNIAGLERFDQFFNVKLFQSIYTKSSNIFAAMPSLHSAYPMVAFYYAWKNKLGIITFILGIVTVGIWFTAVYTSHHYILDVLAGIGCAITGITIFNLIMKTEWAQRLFARYLASVE